MDKPTVFFSHSSKDKELILPLKNKFDEITGRTMNLFMSSDGQSIPFGRNWVHKIEEGLINAQILFIFVTPNSIKSEWIYFEAGYAYSKGIEVIPVGIGINIGQLRAPLNLLQGFNITSVDSMNNFISIINRKFDLYFKGNFTEHDYKLLNKIMTGDKNKFDFATIFENAYYECYSQYTSSEDKTKIVRYQIDKFFSDIETYLQRENIQYSCSNGRILTSGIKINIDGEEIEPNGMIHQNHKLGIILSTFHFEAAFNLLLKFFELFNSEKYIVLQLQFNSDYSCIKKEERLSSIITSTTDIKHNPSLVGSFKYKEKISWWIRNIYDYEPMREPVYKLIFSFKKNEVVYSEIVEFIGVLLSYGIIYEEEYKA